MASHGGPVLVLWAACAAAPVSSGTLTEGGRYRLTVAPIAGGLQLVLTDPAGRPIEDALVHVDLPGALDDPGECDAVGPDRCFHPGGVYVSRVVVPDGPVTVEIDGPAGADRAVIP